MITIRNNTINPIGVGGKIIGPSPASIPFEDDELTDDHRQQIAAYQTRGFITVLSDSPPPTTIPGASLTQSLFDNPGSQKYDAFVAIPDGTNTITSKIAAAVAAGYNSSNPASVYLRAGTFTENVVMKDGISLIGQSGHPSTDLGLVGNATTYANDVIISGNVTFDAAFTTGTIDGVKITGTLALGSNASMTALTVRDSEIRATGAATPAMSGAPTLTPALTFERVRVSNATTQGGGLASCGNFTTAVAFSAIGCSFNSNAGSDISLIFSGGTVSLEKTKLFGFIANATGATTYTFEDVDEDVAGSISYFTATGGGPTITARRWNRVGSSSTAPYVGTFTISESDHIGDANSESIISTMTDTPLRTVRRLTSTATPGASITAAQFQANGDIIQLTTSAGVGSVALPARNTVPGGIKKYIIPSVGGAHATTITPNGTDTINGVNAAVSGPGTLTAGFVLISNPSVATDWLVIIGS